MEIEGANGEASMTKPMENLQGLKRPLVDSSSEMEEGMKPLKRSREDPSPSFVETASATTAAAFGLMQPCEDPNSTTSMTAASSSGLKRPPVDSASNMKQVPFVFPQSAAAAAAAAFGLKDPCGDPNSTTSVTAAASSSSSSGGKAQVKRVFFKRPRCSDMMDPRPYPKLARRTGSFFKDGKGYVSGSEIKIGCNLYDETSREAVEACAYYKAAVAAGLHVEVTGGGGMRVRTKESVEAGHASLFGHRAPPVNFADAITRSWCENFG